MCIRDRAFPVTALNRTLPENTKEEDRVRSRSALKSVVKHPSSDAPPLQQKFHKHLTGTFQKILTDIDAAAIPHAKCIRFKILCLFKIDYDAAATNEKARIFLQGLREYLEACLLYTSQAGIYGLGILGSHVPEGIFDDARRVVSDAHLPKQDLQSLSLIHI